MIKQFGLIALTSPKELQPYPSHGGRATTVTRIHPLARYLSPTTIGGKAYSLYRMSSLGFKVPVACCLPMWAWEEWNELSQHKAAQQSMISKLVTGVWDYLEHGWNVPSAARNAAGVRQLRLAVRSGASVSMPGMMDTTLDVEYRSVEHLVKAVEEVFKSFSSERCVMYRKKRGIGEIGTAVIFQAFATALKGGAGTVHSIDPVTGKGWGLFGEVLYNATGEGLVSGKVTPKPINTLRKKRPTIYDELYAGVTVLENAWNGPVEVEFCWSQDQLFYLQCRTAQLSKSGDKPRDLEGTGTLLGRGHPASRGVASGKVVGPTSDNPRFKSRIWVAPMTSPEDYPFMERAQGIITLIGGTTCHAAVVARELGIPCIVAYQGEALDVGMQVHIDGYSGEVYSGK